QRELVASIATGESGRLAELSARAKRVSIHNNYFTFPVIALMVSNHFPAIYSSRDAWLPLFIIIAGGAAVRLVLNLRFTQPMWRPMLAATMVTTVLLLWVSLKFGRQPPPTYAPNPGLPVTFE